jgi:hypothetical protein
MSQNLLERALNAICWDKLLPDDQTASHHELFGDKRLSRSSLAQPDKTLLLSREYPQISARKCVPRIRALFRQAPPCLDQVSQC